MWTLVFLSMCLELRGSVGFFCRGILRLISIIFNSPFEYDVIKRSFGFTRSLFILYVREHGRLGFGMLTVETAVIAFVAVDFNSSNCDRKC